MALKSIVDLLLYGGISKSEYELVNNDVLDINLSNIRVFSCIGAFVFGALAFFSSLVSSDIAFNVPIYICSCIAMLFVAAFSSFFAKSHRWSIKPLIYFFITVFFFFGMYVSFLHLEFPAVAMMVFLIVVPLLIMDRPLNLSLITIAMSAIFSVAAVKLKTYNVAVFDVWDAISYCVVSILVNTVLTHIKFQEVYHLYKISYLSDMDIMTGLKNRNCYERMLHEHPEFFKDGCVCVYLDANGLHELNNSQGHAAGDEMLRTIANELVHRFDTDFTFRIGGDEFVVFSCSLSDADAMRILNDMQNVLDDKSYHVSYGVAKMSADDFHIEDVVRRAEIAMYADKADYYCDPDRNRRHFVLLPGTDFTNM